MSDTNIEANIIKLTVWIENNPVNDQVYFYRGVGLLQLGRNEEALKDFTQAININPQSAQAYYHRGILFNELGRNTEAIEDYTKVIEINPDQAQAYTQKGSTLVKLGRNEEAIKDYTKAIDIDPDDAYAYCNRGVALNHQGRNEDAIKDFTKAIVIDSQLDQAYFLRGSVLNDLGKNEEAIKDYTKAIDINPQKAVAYYNRGVLFIEFERNDEAIDDFSKAIDINPKYADAYCNRGIALNGLGRKQEAIKDYTKAINVNPQSAQAYYNRGCALNELGLKEEALVNYTKALDINPQDASTYNNRGVLFIEFERNDEAINDFSKAIDINPQMADAYRNRGNIIYQLGLQEFIKESAKAIDIDQKQAEAHYKNFFGQLGRFEQAIKDYTKAIDVNPKDAAAYTWRGMVLNLLRRSIDAKKDLLVALQIQPYNPLIYIILGRFALRIEQKQEAYEYFVKCQKLTSQLTQQDKQKYKLTEQALENIKEQVNLILQIDQEISKVKILIKSKSLFESQQTLLQQRIQPIEAEFKQSINSSINVDYKNANNEILKQILKQLNDIQLEHKILKEEHNILKEEHNILKEDHNEIKQKNLVLNEQVFQLQNQRHQIIIKEMNELKQDDNRYIYYQSSYWRLDNYIQACILLSTDLIQKNLDGVIDNDSERVTQIISKVVQQISNHADSIPIVGTVISIISSALEFAFSYHLDYKFNQIVKKFTQIVEERCDGKSDIDEEIQLAIIKQSKQLLVFTQDQQLQEQGLLKHLKQIQEVERANGNRQTQNPYWKQGIVDTLKILRNLLLNYKLIQSDSIKELHIVILESLKDDSFKVNNQQAVIVGQKNCCEKCSDNCQIQ